MTNSTHSSMVSTVPTPARLHCWRQSISGLGTLIVVSAHAIFLDFAKAFDLAPHERLLLKLDHIGVRRDLLSWIRAFLTNRQQRVVCNGYLSTWSQVTLGFPQGSTLGPWYTSMTLQTTQSGFCRWLCHLSPSLCLDWLYYPAGRPLYS